MNGVRHGKGVVFDKIEGRKRGIWKDGERLEWINDIDGEICISQKKEYVLRPTQ